MGSNDAGLPVFCDELFRNLCLAEHQAGYFLFQCPPDGIRLLAADYNGILAGELQGILRLRQCNDHLAGNSVN